MLATKKKGAAAPAGANGARDRRWNPSAHRWPPASRLPTCRKREPGLEDRRRNAGIVVFKSRWDVGTLTFKDEKLSWLDADEEGKNLIIRRQRDQGAVHRLPEGGERLLRVGLQDADGEYRFRDVSWDRGESKKPEELHQFFQAIYPSLLSPR